MKITFIPDDLPELGPDLVSTLTGLQMSLLSSSMLHSFKVFLYFQVLPRGSVQKCHHDQNCGKNVPGCGRSPSWLGGFESFGPRALTGLNGVPGGHRCCCRRRGGRCRARCCNLTADRVQKKTHNRRVDQPGRVQKASLTFWILQERAFC